MTETRSTRGDTDPRQGQQDADPAPLDTAGGGVPPDDPDPGDAPARPTEVTELEARVAELDGRWRAALADLANVRRRSERDVDQLVAVDRARAVAAWLPVLDNLDTALEHAQADPGSIVEGVRAVREQAAVVLAGLGFPRREDAPGTPFDPAVHEAVGVEPSTGVPPGTIVRVLRSGYGNDTNVLRPAAVVVATRPE